MFQDLLLRAGPRAPPPAAHTSAARPRHADALVPDSAGSDTAGTLCPAHWHANLGSRANAANASLPGDTHRCNTVPGDASAETSIRSPSKCTCDAALGDGGLDGSHPRRDTVYGPRELFTPARSSLGAELRTPLRGVFADSSPPTHLPAEPVVSLWPPSRVEPATPLSPPAPLAAMPMAHLRRHAPSPPSTHGGHGAVAPPKWRTTWLPLTRLKR
jgi:hypothetical protein